MRHRLGRQQRCGVFRARHALAAVPNHTPGIRVAVSIAAHIHRSRIDRIDPRKNARRAGTHRLGWRSCLNLDERARVVGLLVAVELLIEDVERVAVGHLAGGVDGHFAFSLCIGLHKPPVVGNPAVGVHDDGGNVLGGVSHIVCRGAGVGHGVDTVLLGHPAHAEAAARVVQNRKLPLVGGVGADFLKPAARRLAAHSRGGKEDGVQIQVERGTDTIAVTNIIVDRYDVAIVFHDGGKFESAGRRAQPPMIRILAKASWKPLSFAYRKGPEKGVFYIVACHIIIIRHERTRLNGILLGLGKPVREDFNRSAKFALSIFV